MQSASTWAASLTEQPLLQALVADAQATVEQTMGNSESAQRLRPRLASASAATAGTGSVLAAVTEYFHRRRRPSSEWHEYAQLPLSAMAQAVEERSVDQIEGTWNLARNVIEQELPEPLLYRITALIPCVSTPLSKRRLAMILA